MNIVILDDYQNCVHQLDAFARLSGHEVTVHQKPLHGTEALVHCLASADALVLTRERTAVNAALLDRLPRLRLISAAGSLPGNLDLQACSERGIAVADGHGTGAPTAELCWALILASRRRLVEEVDSLRSGRWQGFLGQQLRGQRLGIWGYGRVGRQIAAYGRAFDMAVWVWGSEGSRARAQADGYEAAPSRAEFLACSDVLSLHLRLTPQMEGGICAGDLLTMKADALFVNTARAELLAPGALLQALNAGRPGFAALDVFENEPVLDIHHPLLRHPKVLATPHIGFVERANYESYFGIAFDNINRFAAGETRHLLNADELARNGR